MMYRHQTRNNFNTSDDQRMTITGLGEIIFQIQSGFGI